MSETLATEPTPDAIEPAPEPEVAPEAPAVEPVQPEGDVTTVPEPDPEAPEPDPSEVQPDPLEALAPEPVPDTVEVEINGLKYTVPATLKDGYMMHGDYTLKTQELAGKGRELDGDRDALKGEREAFNQQAQTHRDNIQDYGELAHTDKLLDSFRKVDFQQLQQEDPDQAQRLNFQFQTLNDARRQIVERIQTREYDARVTAERERGNATREHANRKDQLKASLARDIPNYSPELQSKMDQTAIRNGFTQADLDSVVDPKMMQMLHLAHLGEQVLQRKRAATTQPAPTPVKPVPKVGGGPTPVTGPNDKQGMDAWMRSRNQQIRRDTG
jgi:hypothetical protein